ncbi:MAG: FkbM family methyltransferase [Woeseiaceae bacterium]
MAMVDQSLPKENFRDWLNEFRQDLKFRYVPFRGYYKLRAYKYMLWKSPEMGLLQFLTDPRKDSLDIGANLGLFTYFLARYTRHVYAFEPNPYPLRSLKAVIDRNVTVLPMAVSDRSGEAELVVPKSRKGWSSNGAALDKKTTGRAARLTVPCTTIDDLDYRDIGFIKIDIEGHEKAALLGARRTIARERPNLFIENELVHAGSEVSEGFALLHDMDYDGFALIDGVLTNLRHFSFEERQTKYRGSRNRHGYVKNFIFIPK